MRVAILGPLACTDDGTDVTIGGTRLRTLLIRLALDAGRTVTTDALGDAVWPDGAPDDRANALQSLVSRLRRAVPGIDVRAQPGGYRLELEADDVDALRFERLVRDGRRLLADHDPVGAATVLHDALAMWRGAALADVADEPFAQPVTARLTGQRLAAIEDLAEAELAAGAEPAAVAERLDHLVSANPWRERLHALHIRALAAAGRNAEALTAFEDTRRRLADDLGTDPGPALREAHLAVLRSGDAPARVRGNLPAARTELVGRADEQAAVVERLRHHRVVTLAGPGGAGKTRLAIAVGTALADDVAGGVWLVELAPLTNPADVAHAVVDVLGVRESGFAARPEVREDGIDRLVHALSGRETVVVLDNCEHLIDGVARLADTLLSRCPDLRILGTSREPLGVPGESLVDVGPLALPAPDASLSAATASPAVRLFCARARAVRPDFAVDDATVRDVVEVCRRLDGLPLALELAAARLRALPVREIRRRLDERFDLLTHGSRTAPARHRTLAGVVAWSWELLEPAERSFAQRLSVFPGTITLEGATWVGETPAALDLLSALVDKSLLQRHGGTEPRFRMLETIRGFAADRLVESGDAAAARAALVSYAVDLAERAEPKLRGPGQVPWLARLRTERDTLDAAVQAARADGLTEAAGRLAAALCPFWTIQLDPADAAERLRRARADLPPAATGTAVTVDAFHLFSSVLAGEPLGADDLDQVEAALRECSGTPADVVGQAFLRPLLALLRDDPDAARSAIDRALATADPWTGAMLLLIRAMAVGTGGDLAAMDRDLELAAEAFREAGERWGLSTTLTILGLTLTMFGDERAGHALDEAIHLRRELDPSDAAVEQRAWLAQFHALTGQTELARAELDELVDGAPGRYVALAHTVLGDLARYAGELGEARRQYLMGAQVTEHADDAMFDALLLSSMAHLDVTEHDRGSARGHIDAALRHALGIRDMPLVAVVAVALARLLAEDGDPATAAAVLGAATALRGAPDVLNPDVAAVTDKVRADLGEHAVAAIDRGARMDRDAALALVSDQARVR